MKIVIRENNWLPRDLPGLPSEYQMDFGWGNGYVLIPTDHPLFGKDYDEINRYISVHGGLTYGSIVSEETLNYWSLDEEDLGKWCVGFDTAHYEDTLLNCPKEYVQAETDSLAEQLTAYAENNK